MKQFSFTRQHRLKSSKALSNLYKEGKTFSIYPLRVHFLLIDEDVEESMVKCAFSVPKRIHKKAVHRNRLKRQMREAFRLNQGCSIRPEKGQSLHILILYFAPEMHVYGRMDQAMKKILNRLVKKVARSDD